MATQLKVVSVERVSVGSDGEQGEGASIRGVFSADGAKLLLQSGARFVPEDLNSYGDIYLKDMATGAVERLTLDPDIADPESGGYEPEISADGTRVAYTSTFAVTIGGITGLQETVVFKDLITGEDKVISASADGEPGNDSSFYAHFSPDGTQIAFTSYATNLIPGLTLVGDAVFLKDIASGDIHMLSSSAAGQAANNYSVGVGFTPDGSRFAFSSLADNLIEDDGNGVRDIFTKDLTTGEVLRLSVGADGTEGNGDSSEGSFSPDGSKLLFASRATNFVTGDGNGAQDLFIKDLVSGEITLVSTDSLGNQWVADSYGGVFSPDGTKIAFYSDTAGLAVRDDNGAQDVFVKDLVSGALTVLSANIAGEIGDAQSFWPQFLPDGSGVLFTSYAANLVPDDTNGERDLFIARFEEQQLGGPVQWTEAEGGNGHWYEFVEGPLTWVEARADAESRGHLGLPGYLATITSEEENAFVLSVTPPNVWVGGSDAASEGVWSWAGGPEAGQVFWNSTVGAIGYADWGGQEPNDAGGEDYLLAHALYPTGTWADAGVPPNPNSRFGYVVEYSAPGHSFAEITPGRTEAETFSIEGGFKPWRNVWASDGAYLQATGTGEARATGSFSGAEGTYSLTIGYFDESDGASRLRVELNGETLDEWVWDTDPAGRIVTGDALMHHVLPEIEMTPGDVLSLVGTADGGEPLRVDFLDIREAPPEGAPLRVEAETLEILKGFEVVTNPWASGGSYLQAGGLGTQRAAFHFTGTEDRYDLTVGYFDETDGVSRMRVLVNGVQVDDWLWSGTSGDAIVTGAGAAEHVIKGLDLAPGDRIELVGTPSGGEPVRTDFLEFTPSASASGPSPDLWFLRDDEVMLALNDGTGGFTVQPAGILRGDGTLLTTDLDGDGDNDFLHLLVAPPYLPPDTGVDDFEFDLVTSIYENDGTGHFAAPRVSTAPVIMDVSPVYISGTASLYELLNPVDLGDVDGDGDIDFIANSIAAMEVMIFDNDGAGNFASLAATPYDLGEQRSDAMFADLDDNAALDAAVFTGSDWYGLNAFVNDGSGGLQVTGFGASGEGGIGDGQVLDLDGDGDNDIIYIVTGENRAIVTYMNDGAGGHQTGVEPAFRGDSDGLIGTIEAGQFDHDPAIEVISAGVVGDEAEHAPGLRVFEIVEVLGGAAFELSSFDPSISGNVQAQADYDLDGDLDLLMWEDSDLVLLRNDGDAVFFNAGVVLTGEVTFVSNGDEVGYFDDLISS
ncbi:PD40 domain-containing protein [Salipiger mangrovisoli]|uniref:PD40 domain-containing protein n=1 Tax=Salipiger mangrovisoli TaxID=2865933 RepID=A0ABR9XB17_9RHOB|nr:PD40 domain-containing protein [Salipiger mangrovisoli]MBE9640640.1 PD40 domain-containing protein [Salipiger mangrovisoli]